MKKVALMALRVVKELAEFAAFILAVKYVPWEALVFVIVVGVIAWIFGELG